MIKMSKVKVLKNQISLMNTKLNFVSNFSFSKLTNKSIKEIKEQIVRVSGYF